MTRYSGISKIFRFNWPWYALSVVLSLGGLLFLSIGNHHLVTKSLGIAGIFLADLWLIASVVVSHWIYDRSEIANGVWLKGYAIEYLERVGIFHAGLDELGDSAEQILAGSKIQRFDFYDPARSSTPSLERARFESKKMDLKIGLDHLPLNDESLDLALLAFSIHEIRRHEDRILFLREISRILTPKGKVLLVEHLRDGWNFLAYGPGFLHFYSRRTWKRAFEESGMTIIRERSITPFIHFFELGKRV